MLAQIGALEQVGRVQYYLKLHSVTQIEAEPLRLGICTLFQPLEVMYSANATSVEAGFTAISVDAIKTVLATAEPSLENQHDSRDHGKLIFMNYGNRPRM